MSHSVRNLLGLLVSSVKAPVLESVKPVLDHMVELLLTLRHPGAFCAIEEPLRMVAGACFQAGAAPAVQSYPGAVLRQAVQDCLLHPEIQVTRRSAGLPICVSAILAAAAGQSKDRRPGGICAASLAAIPTETMLALVGGLDLSQADPSPAVIHALNILRSFFRNAHLDSLSGPYVSRAFECCFRSFGSASWSVCNGAMMLLGALVRRAFGSASAKDPSLDAEAQVDLRQLAAKFPDLLPCLEAQIGSAGNSITARIYPLLSVLQRVRFSSGAIASYPSLFETAFDFLVEICLANEGAKIRMMTARLLLNSWLPACPELVWPRLQAYLLRLKGSSANSLASKLLMLTELSEKLSDNLLAQESLLRRLWQRKEVPAAIRWPALRLWSRISGKKAEASDIDPSPRIQPYQFEFCSELATQIGHWDFEDIAWTSLRYRLLTLAPPTSGPLSAFGSLQIEDAAPRLDCQNR